MADRDPGAFEQARCPGTSWEDILAAVEVQRLAFMGEDRCLYLGYVPIVAARFYSRDFFRAECV